MSRLTTKQRRARLWRREWCKDFRDIAARTEPGFPVPVWLMVAYAHELARAEPPAGLGLRSPRHRLRRLSSGARGLRSPSTVEGNDKPGRNSGRGGRAKP